MTMMATPPELMYGNEKALHEVAEWQRAELERLRAALEKIADPLLLPTEGVGLAKAMSIIAEQAKIARDAVKQ
jgi:hypothetical protein